MSGLYQWRKAMREDGNGGHAGKRRQLDPMGGLAARPRRIEADHTGMKVVGIVRHVLISFDCVMREAYGYVFSDRCRRRCFRVSIVTGSFVWTGRVLGSISQSDCTRARLQSFAPIV